MRPCNFTKHPWQVSEKWISVDTGDKTEIQHDKTLTPPVQLQSTCISVLNLPRNSHFYCQSILKCVHNVFKFTTKCSSKLWDTIILICYSTYSFDEKFLNCINISISYMWVICKISSFLKMTFQNTIYFLNCNFS